jgi:aminoglycoside phosphotransferase
MALSPIMLTAWAVAEIPNLHIDGYRESSIEGLDRVTCRTAEGDVVTIASPTSAEAAAIQDREHRVGQLLSAGVRERLGFDVPHTLGAGVLDKRRMVVTVEAQGQALSTIRDVRPMLPSLALALANLHSLPTNIVKRDSIPTKTSLDAVREAAGIIDRAHQTTHVPSALLDRWDAAIEDKELWQFSPTITHGDLEFDYILTAGDDVVGITHWAEARVGDPAADLMCVVGPLAPEVSAGFITDYIAHRSSNDRRVGHRARFLSELEVARWLVHGVDTNDEAKVDDAVKMLTNLVASVTDNPARSLGASPVKPVSLVTDATGTAPIFSAEAATEVVAPVPDAVPESVEAFEDDAPTVVAPEPAVLITPVVAEGVIVNEIVVEEIIDAEIVDDEVGDGAVAAESDEPTPSFLGGSDYTEESVPVVVDEPVTVVEPGSVEATIVEAFFSDDEPDEGTPREEEIL